jgi:hypothetical protein
MRIMVRILHGWGLLKCHRTCNRFLLNIGIHPGKTEARKPWPSSTHTKVTRSSSNQLATEDWATTRS